MWYKLRVTRFVASLYNDSVAWDFGQGWVQLGIALFAAAFLVGAAHQSRTAIAAERFAASGDHAAAAAQLRAGRGASP